MRAKFIACTFIALFAFAAFGQPPAQQDVERVLYLTRSATAQDLSEIATIIRSAADIKQVSTDATQRAVSLRGPAANIALAEWLFNELGQPANSARREYRMPGGADDVARVFFLRNAGTPQILAEVATLVRTIVNVPRLFLYVSPRALTLRGTDEQMALAEWLIHELDQSANRQDSSVHEYRLPSRRDDIVRVFFLAHAGTPQRLAEIATQIRGKAEIQRLMIYNGPRAIAMRATASQIAVADRLMWELDR